MEKINHYVSLVNQAFTVAKDNLNNPESLKKAETYKEALINSLEKDSFIKVPLPAPEKPDTTIKMPFLFICSLLHYLILKTIFNNYSIFWICSRIFSISVFNPIA